MCIVGPGNGTQSTQGTHCNQIALKEADTKDVGKHYFQTKTSVEENDVREMLTRLRNGHYQVPFPFKDLCVNLSNNRHQERCSYLEKNLAKMTNSERITSGLRRIYSCKGLCQEIPLERLVTYPIKVSTIQTTSLER